MIHAGHLLLACGFSDQGYDVFFATDLQRRDTRLDPEEQGLVSRAFPVAEFEKMIGGGVIQDATTVAAYALLRLKGFL
jgi:ADP-ribose pyrophosphatase